MEADKTDAIKIPAETTMFLNAKYQVTLQL